MNGWIITLLYFSVLSAYAQQADTLRLTDSLFLMNGEILPTKILDTLPETVYCLHPRPTKKHPERKLLMERDRLFSVKYANGTERVFYIYDTMAGNFFTVPEMRNFMHGEQDAARYHNTALEFWLGAGIGFASGALLPNYGGYFYAYLPPFAYSGALLIPFIKVRAPNYKVRGAPHYDVYLVGYERVARKKKIVASLKGAAIGLVAGSLLYFSLPDSFYDKHL
ncbi:MAG: hypothetical protein IT233_02465 [Bacteroidia bacterium]|nr:hypothetical protein [Bacteroidia bacterium]